MCSKAWWSLQLLPLDPSSPPISSPPPPLSTLSLCFLVPKCLHQLDLLTLHKHFTLHCPPVKFLNVCFLIFLMLLPIFQRQLPNFFCIIYYLPIFPATHPLQVAFSPLNISNTLCRHMPSTVTSYNIVSSQLLPRLALHFLSCVSKFQLIDYLNLFNIYD